MSCIFVCVFRYWRVFCSWDGRGFFPSSLARFLFFTMITMDPNLTLCLTAVCLQHFPAIVPFSKIRFTFIIFVMWQDCFFFIVNHLTRWSKYLLHHQRKWMPNSLPTMFSYRNAIGKHFTVKCFVLKGMWYELHYCRFIVTATLIPSDKTLDFHFSSPIELEIVPVGNKWVCTWNTWTRNVHLANMQLEFFMLRFQSFKHVFLSFVLQR